MFIILKEKNNKYYSSYSISFLCIISPQTLLEL